MKLAGILIRSPIGAKQGVKDTLEMLNLTQKNRCVVLEDNGPNRGMLSKADNFITYGEIDEETEQKLKDEAATTGKDNVFRLQPPRKGFARKGIKVHYKHGGAHGYREDNISELIQRMI